MAENERKFNLRDMINDEQKKLTPLFRFNKPQRAIAGILILLICAFRAYQFYKAGTYIYILYVDCSFLIVTLIGFMAYFKKSTTIVSIVGAVGVVLAFRYALWFEFAFLIWAWIAMVLSIITENKAQKKYSVILSDRVMHEQHQAALENRRDENYKENPMKGGWDDDGPKINPFKAPNQR